MTFIIDPYRFGAVGPVVTISDQTITEFNFSVVARAGIRVNTDGTIDKFTTTGGYEQVSASTDWIIPNGSADSLYEVRVTNISGNPVWTSFAPTSSARDTWLDLSTDRLWINEDANSGTGERTATMDLEIRYNGGAVIDSGSITLTANYDSSGG